MNPAGLNSKSLMSGFQTDAFGAFHCFGQTAGHGRRTEQVPGLPFGLDLPQKLDRNNHGSLFALFVRDELNFPKLPWSQFRALAAGGGNACELQPVHR